MNECIICRKSQKQFSDEHVIPDAIGGHYHIHNVCKSCNSLLGSKVDSKLVNHKFMEFLRFNNKIKSKSNKLPNPLTGIHTNEENPEFKIQLRLNNNDNLSPYILPTKPNLINLDNNTVKITFTLDEADIDKHTDIIRDICKRNNLPIDSCEITREDKQVNLNKITATFPIDLLEFKICLLKIAYEFAIDCVKGYYQDPSAIDISKTLLNANYEDALNYCHGSGFDDFILREYSKFIDFKDENHYLILSSLQNVGLVCYVCLFNSFSIAIKLSNFDNYKISSIFGINHTKEKKFQKKDTVQLALDYLKI